MNNPTARHNGLVIQDTPNEVLVYDLNNNKAHCLNSSAALIWKACDGTRSVADIVREFDASNGEVTEDFVWLAIDQLSENGLLENEVAPRFAGQSRRQVIKKIGLASLVALPVIASLMAPQNALGSVSCVCSAPVTCATLQGCPSITNCNQAGLCAPSIPNARSR